MIKKLISYFKHNKPDTKSIIKSGIEKIKRQVPCLLVYIDIADLKRRNAYLGHEEGDKDIADLINIVNKLGKKGVPSVRVAGDKVLSCFISIDDINKLINLYKKSQHIDVNLETRSIKGNKRVEKKAICSTSISRAVRCIYCKYTIEEDFEALYNELKNKVLYAYPNEPKPLNQIATIGREPWICLHETLEYNIECLFCGSEDIEWEDGDSMSGNGICKKCKATFTIAIY